MPDKAEALNENNLVDVVTGLEKEDAVLCANDDDPEDVVEEKLANNNDNKAATQYDEDSQRRRRRLCIGGSMAFFVVAAIIIIIVVFVVGKDEKDETDPLSNVATPTPTGTDVTTPTPTGTDVTTPTPTGTNVTTTTTTGTDVTTTDVTTTTTDEKSQNSLIGEAEDKLSTPANGTEQPNFENVSVYNSYFEIPEVYQHLHVHVMSLNRASTNNAGFGFFADTPDAILTVQAKGEDTGSSDFFDVGTHTFPTVRGKEDGEKLFEWDYKGVILYKVGGTNEFEFLMIDEDLLSEPDLLFKLTLGPSDLPKPGDGWVELSKVSEKNPDYDALDGSNLVFKIKVTNGYYVSQSDMDDIHNDTDTIDYSEHVLSLESGDKALAQAWVHKDTGGITPSSSSRKAVLWLIGRNDVFMHPHVAKELFFDVPEQTIDLYVLNWRFNGQNLKRGFVDNPYYNSHNPWGDMNVYIEEIELILELIEQNGPYDAVLGYGHSTGAAILLNYLIESKANSTIEDDRSSIFDVFLFNSPFLDWNQADATELILENLPGSLENSFFMSGPTQTPEEFKDTPIIYLGKEIVVNDKWAKGIYSMYYSEWSIRVKYRVPVTAGFARMNNQAFAKINKGDITSKPTMVLTSESDDVLSSEEIVSLSENINQERELQIYRYNEHDVFLSPDYDDTLAAIAGAKKFLEAHFY